MINRKAIFTRLGKLGDEDVPSDFETWENLGVEERFKAAWELVIQAHTIRGDNLDELRFQRSVENLIRKWS